MESLKDLVPDHDPVKDATVSVGAALVSTVPVVGSAVSQVGTGLIASRQAARQHEFDQAVAETVTALTQQIDGLTPQAILDSDEFMAAYSRASRAAAETASKRKRARLASALRHAGPWSRVPNDQRIRFLGLVADYEDVDVALLRYLSHPEEWLTANSSWKSTPFISVSTITIMQKHFFAEHEDWAPYLDMTLKRLTRDDLVVELNWRITVNESSAIDKKTTKLGDAFLGFLG